MSAKRSNGKLLVLLGVLAIGAIYLLVWRPRAQELSDVRSQRDAMTAELSALQASPPVISSPTSTPPAADALAKAIPDHPELAELLRQFQSIAADAGVSQQSVSPSPMEATTAGPGGSLAVEISVSGPKPALYDYMRRLAGLERLFVVNKMTLAPATSDGSTASTDASVPIDGFHLDISGRAFTAAVPSGSSNG
jgi:Tfp pilus assembly protein PilO